MVSAVAAIAGEAQEDSALVGLPDELAAQAISTIKAANKVRIGRRDIMRLGE